MLFTDFGNVWEASLTYRLRELSLSLGAGLRYETPVGPIRLDVATPLLEGRRPVAFYFSLGHAF